MSLFTIVPVAPLRAESTHRSEMVSQLLFGELCDLLESTKEFLRVKAHYDGYEGWCQRSQLVDYGSDSYLGETGFVSAWTDEVLIDGNSCIIPHASIAERRQAAAFTIGQNTLMHLSESIHYPSASDDKAALVKAYANRYLGVAYIWGGKSVFGTDCSGFVQQVFKMVDTWLPRDSGEQANLGETVNFIQEARLGDLAFFDNAEGRIVHVGMMLNNQEIIHASGNVHVDDIDNEGIVNKVTGLRTHQLRIIKRFF
ncbi:MAG: C40 family peptidase [Bacteroidota bacterium]